MRTALVVDDEKKVRDIYKRFLSQEKFAVLEAENGQQVSTALAKAEALDLVLLDIRLPIVSGAELFTFIKTRYPAAKVIIASVYPLEDQRRLIATADGYFDKAEGIEMLLSRIRTVLHANHH